MKKIFVCSPLAGDVEENIKAAERYCDYVIRQGHVPFAPHVFFTRFLNEDAPGQRELGIQFGLSFLDGWADELWYFGDRISTGMHLEISKANENDIPVFNIKELACTQSP
jgi:hypothetical protein